MGDFNFCSTWAKEEQNLASCGFRDVMHDFVDKNVFTMNKSKRFKAWRPDKIVMESKAQMNNKSGWKI